MSIIEVFSALLTPVLAIIATIILILQYFLEKRRWRLDLYDKRYPVYLNTMNFISTIVNKRDLTNKEIFDFLRSSKDKEFLFGEDIQSYLKDIYSQANEFELLKRELDDRPVGEERKKLVEKEGELLKWFLDQFEISKSKFGKYLKIDKK